MEKVYPFRHRTILVVDTYADPSCAMNDWDWVDLFIALMRAQARVVSQESLPIGD